MPGYQITLAAEEDLRSIWRYTFDAWGPEQADKYLNQIEDCLDAIGDRRVRSRSFQHLPDGVCVHRCQHHYIFWIVIDRAIIIAVLHEKMDVVQRLADRI
jgi:toxin ParE1/3/4